tara:strand:- start:2 stop:1849 length:1848 start_codon:yes stop_codon:yes gene_type:complete
MAIIYTYPTKAVPNASDLILISDSEDSNKTKQITVTSLPFTNNTGTVTSIGIAVPAAFEASAAITTSGTITIGVTGGNVGQYLAYDGTWGTPAGGAANPAGAVSQIQYHDTGGVFGASANLSFSTDRFTVVSKVYIKGDGTSNAGKLRLHCQDNTTPHYVELIGPAHSGSPVSYSLTLPNALPNVANQILESNASGTLSWIATPTGGSSYSAGDGLDLNGTVFSAGRLTNGGLVINGAKLQVDLAATAMSGELRAVDGGTGQSVYGVGDLLYAETTTTLAKITLGTSDKILGVNTAGTAPEWITNLVGKEVTTGHMLVGAGTSAMTGLDTSIKGTIAVGNGSTTTTLAAGTDTYVLTAKSAAATGLNWEAPASVNLTSGVSGILPVANGGTGSSSNPAIQGSILYSNSGGVYTTATSLKYNYDMLSSISSSTTYPSLQTSSSNATSSTAAWSTTIGAVNMYNGSSTGGATTLAIGGEDTVAQSVSRLITFYGASHLAAGLYACGYLLADRSANSVSLSNASDYRLKENVAPLSSSTDKIKALNPVSYNFIGQTKVVEGFLAHEIQTQFPNAVTGEKDSVSENGEINPQLLDYTKIIPVLVGTIKELTARIEALEA